MEPENCVERPLCRLTERWIRMRKEKDPETNKYFMHAHIYDQCEGETCTEDEVRLHWTANTFWSYN